MKIINNFNLEKINTSPRTGLIMKNILFTLLLSVLCSCIDMGGSKNSTPKGTGSGSAQQPLIYNFNPVYEIDVSEMLDKYSGVKTIQIGAEGRSVSSIPVEELRKNPVVRVGSPGGGSILVAKIILNDGTVISEVIR